jgi:hypothetical protein
MYIVKDKNNTLNIKRIPKKLKNLLYIDELKTCGFALKGMASETIKIIEFSSVEHTRLRFIHLYCMFIY